MHHELKNWPVEYKNEIIVGNLKKSVAVCALWSERNYVAEQVGLENIAAVGNLYSHGPGIEGIIRNILANPAIRSIVVAGKDRSRSSETLLNFFSAGVSQTDLGWTIPLPAGISIDNLPDGVRTIDKAIPLEEIENLRKNVEVIDLRGREWQEIKSIIMSLQEKQPFAEPAIFPKTESKVDVMHGEGIGFTFRGERPEEIWMEILRTIRQFGSHGENRYTSKTQELLNTVAVLDGDLEHMMDWPAWVGHSPDSVREYASQLINGTALDADDTYAYGERMRVRRGDQIKHLIERLKSKPTDRGLQIDLWDVNTDFFGAPQSPPCLTHVWFRVYQGKLCANFTYRSHDIYGSWIKNTIGDRLLQAHVAEEAGIPIGRTTVVSYSAHIYSHNFAEVDGLIKEHPPKWGFSEDPRGNFIIAIEGDHISVRHENRSGAITILKGASAQELYKEIWSKKLLLYPDHAMYIGSELTKAQSALLSGLAYSQDMA